MARRPPTADDGGTRRGYGAAMAKPAKARAQKASRRPPKLVANDGRRPADDLTQDDLAAIAMLVQDARSAGEQAIDARDHGAHEQAESLDTDRRFAIAQIYKILRVDRP